jgi:hypothetical protein
MGNEGFPWKFTHRCRVIWIWIDLAHAFEIGSLLISLRFWSGERWSSQVGENSNSDFPVPAFIITPYFVSCKISAWLLITVNINTITKYRILPAVEGSCLYKTLFGNLFQSESRNFHISVAATVCRFYFPSISYIKAQYNEAEGVYLQ